MYYNREAIGKIFWGKLTAPFSWREGNALCPVVRPGAPIKKGCVEMKVTKPAVAGTLESSDAQVTVEPGAGELTLEIQSSVLNQYGKQIRATILETLGRLEVTDAKVTVVDKGALDCTLKARVECAVFRSCGLSEANIPWGGAVR